MFLSCTYPVITLEHYLIYANKNIEKNILGVRQNTVVRNQYLGS